MLERKDVTNEVLEPITFVLAYPTALASARHLNAATGIVYVSDSETKGYVEHEAEMGIAVHHTAH
jgi:hypothetical protein